MLTTDTEPALQPVQPDRDAAPAPDTGGRAWSPLWTTLRGLALVALVGAGAWYLANRGTELRGAADLLGHVEWWWTAAAVLFEAASMVVFARMQRWLLRAGGVRLPMATMVEITLAGNAISATLPGGVAWAAAWAFGQLRRRGVDRFLRVWVFLVAGTVSSFALFVVVALGVLLAGRRGPVADLRWTALGLAAISVAAVAAALLRRRLRVRSLEDRLVAYSYGHLVGRRRPAGRARAVLDRILAVHLSRLQWAAVLGLALLNWLYDCCVLVCALKALHMPVPWRDVFVIYGITQIAATVPLTPGGLGVVEGSMAALLTAYGLGTEASLATVVLYRIVSFWGLVPIGWAVWVRLHLLQRRGRPGRAHPWAFHGVPQTRRHAAFLPDPQPCNGCDQETDDRSIRGARRQAVTDAP
jgi:uncharacterized membrane protein YbhN (UPF0104 family)